MAAEAGDFPIFVHEILHQILVAEGSQGACTGSYIQQGVAVLQVHVAIAVKVIELPAAGNRTVPGPVHSGIERRSGGVQIGSLLNISQPTRPY